MLKYQYTNFVIVMVGVGLLALNIRPKTPRLLYNPSESAPIGWYSLEPTHTYHVGDHVAVYLNEDAARLAVDRDYILPNIPIIKTIAAGPGSRYCVSHQLLTIGTDWQVSMELFDRHGREMPRLPAGCTRLLDGEFLVLSNRTQQSFDSRYFGSVHASNILGTVKYLGKAAQMSGWQRVDEG